MKMIDTTNLTLQERFDVSVYLYHSADIHDIAQMMESFRVKPAMTDSLRARIKTTNRYDQGKELYEALTK